MPSTTDRPSTLEMPHPATTPTSTQSTPPPPKWRAALKKWLMVAGLFLMVAAALSPLAAKWGINHYLKTRFSSTIALRQLSFNPLTTQLNLSVQKSSQMVLDRFQMEWDWLPLRRRTLRLNEIHLKNLTVEIKPLAGGGVQIGDIHLEGAKKAVSQAIEPGSALLPIYVDVRHVVLENVNVKYTDPQFQATLTFERLQLQATGASGASFLHYGLLKNSDQRLDFTGDVRISGLLLEPPIIRQNAASQKSSPLEKLQGLSALVSGLVKLSGLHVELQSGLKPGRMTPVFRVASVELADNAAIRLEGSKGFRTALDVTFQPVDIQLKNLDSARPGEETAVTLATAAGGKSSIQYSLKGKPLEKPLSLDGTGRIVQFSLPPLSPLAERFAGYRIQKGLLNLDPPLSVKRGLLDSKWNMVLNQLEVEKLDTSTGHDPVEEFLGVPLESSVGLLKDKQGDIRLEIPLKVDVNDPDKAFSAVMSRAISAGIKSGVRASLSKVLPPVSSPLN